MEAFPAPAVDFVDLSRDQGCQMVSFKTKNTTLGEFWRSLDWKIWIYFMAIWNILRKVGFL
jgi:hypothetical protein